MHSTKWRIPYAYTAQRNYNIKKHINFSLYNKLTYNQIHTYVGSLNEYDEPTSSKLLQLDKQLFIEEGIGNGIVDNRAKSDYSKLDVFVDELGIPDFSRHRDGSVNYGYISEEKRYPVHSYTDEERHINNDVYLSSPTTIIDPYQEYISGGGDPNEYELFSEGNFTSTPFDYDIFSNKNKDIKNMARLSSLVKKGVTEGKGWSAPIIIFDTETTSLKPNRQTVNIAALKVRYNFKTSKWAILDTYERYYLPDFNFGEFRKYNNEDAIDIYNQSESVRIHGLTTEQIRANRIGYDKLIAETFNTSEQKAFVNWLTKDSEYPIIVGNNIRFDALSINDAFVKYTGYNPTYLDLMDMAQATPELIADLAKDKRLHGKGGLSVQRMYSRLMHDADYVEKHFGAQDVLDEFSIFRVLTEKIRNSYNSPEGWERLSSVIRENSPVSGKFVQYPWNTVPMELEYNNSDISAEFFEDIGLSSKDAQNIYVKYKLGKYNKPGTLGSAILDKLKINKESLAMNILSRDVHKMTKKQRKEYKKELERKKFMHLTGDRSVVETMTFDGDTLVSNGFINEDYVDYDESDYEKAEFNNADERGKEHFISWNEKDRDIELSLDNKDNITLYNAGSYEIDTNDIKKQRKRNKGYAKSVSHALYNAREAEEYNEETSVEDFSDKQLLESIVAEMNKYPSYRGKLYVIYTGSEYKIVSDDPIVSRKLETGIGTLDMLPDEYDEKSTSKRYSKLYTEEDIFDEIRRRLHMNVETKWQERIRDLRRYQRKGLISQDKYDKIMAEMNSYNTDEQKLDYLEDNKLKSLIAPPIAYRTDAWQEAMEQIHNDVAVGQQKSLKFRQKLDRLVDSGYMTEDRAEYIYNQKRYYGASDSDINDMINQKQYEKDVKDYLANEDANAAAIREAEIKAASERAAKERAYEESYLNRRSSDKYAMQSMREGLGDRVDYLVNHGKLSKGTADAILSQFDAQVAAGTGSMESFEKALNKATKEIDKNVVSQQKATKAWESMIKPTDFNAVYQAGYAQINGVLGAASGVLPNFMMNPMKRAGAAVINGFEVDRARYNYYARTAGMLKNNLSVAGAVLGSFVPGLGAVPGMAIGAGIGEIGTSWYNQAMWRKERHFNETGNIIQNSLNTVGFLKSISGLDIAFSALTKTVKWATLGFVGMVTKGLHSMQSLGNPITQLSGVGYSNYQVYGRMDRMFGFSNGTINSSIENFALQQRRMYTYGQMDIDRVVAASMLGVFGNVYANGGDPKKNYEETVNKIASGGITDTKLSWAAMIDKTLPQILQIMKDMNAGTLNDVYRQSGVTFNELTDEERKKMRRVSFGYRTSLSNISTSWQRMGAALWDGGLNKVFDRVSKWIETIAQNADVWMQKINPLIDAFDKLFTAFKSGDSSQIDSAIKNLKNEFGKAFDNLKEPIARMVSGISVAMLAGMQTMLPSITKMLRSLIGEIGKFSFDKDALMYNMNYGTQLPIIRYGEQKGQIVWTGGKLNKNEEEYIDWLNSQDVSINKKRKAMKEHFGPIIGINGKRRWVSTDDYTPIAAISAAQDVIEKESNNLQEGEMFKQFYTAMMKAFESFGLTINLKDDSTGNTRKLDSSTSLGAYAIQKAVSNQ